MQCGAIWEGEGEIVSRIPGRSKRSYILSNLELVRGGKFLSAGLIRPENFSNQAPATYLGDCSKTQYSKPR
jgi:hypothetical protein